MRPSALPPVIPRAPHHSSRAIVCRHVFDAIAVHANGDIVCWDTDIHGKRVYGNVFEDSIAQVFHGEGYNQIRDWLLSSAPDSWCPAIDAHCPLRSVSLTDGQHAPELRIKTIRLEPITYCNLHCPICAVETTFKRIPEMRAKRGYKKLPLEMMLSVVEQLPDLETIEFYGFGEPFLHKDAVAFLRSTRQERPELYIVTNTNGTVLTPKQISAIAGESLLDRVVFSIDGATEQSYQKYRVGSTYERAIGKLKSLVAACREAGTWKSLISDAGRGVQITWQYILFEWNDSDEEIDLAKTCPGSAPVRQN